MLEIFFIFFFLIKIRIGLLPRTSILYMGYVEANILKPFFFFLVTLSHVLFTCVVNSPSTFPFISSWYFISTSLASQCGRVTIHHCLRPLNLATESVKVG